MSSGVPGGADQAARAEGSTGSGSNAVVLACLVAEQSALLVFTGR